MTQVGYLSNGGAWLSACHELLAEDMSLRPTVFDTSRRRPARLTRVDVLLIPWAPDATWIVARRAQLIRFLSGGGVVIAFGEFESDWLPNMIWTKAIEDDVQITTGPLSDDGERARRMIFDGLSSADLSNWFDTCHGYFRALPPQADVLATNEAGQPVVVLDSASFKGALLASSIDPDFHTYAKNDRAKRMFKQMVEWALVHAEAEGGYRREVRLPRRAELERFAEETLPTVVVEVTVTIMAAITVALLWPS